MKIVSCPYCVETTAELQARIETLAYCVETTAELQARIETLEDALQCIVQWSDAYPPNVFTEPDWKHVHALLEAGGISLDAVSASNMRHAVGGIGKSPASRSIRSRRND